MTACFNKCTVTPAVPMIVRGDSLYIEMVFATADDEPIDATGWNIWFIVKASLNDTFEQAVLLVNREVEAGEDAEQGRVVIALTSEETSTLVPGKYHFEFKRVLTNFDPPDVWTFHASNKKPTLEVYPGTVLPL